MTGRGRSTLLQRAAMVQPQRAVSGDEVGLLGPPGRGKGADLGSGSEFGSGLGTLGTHHRHMAARWPLDSPRR